MLVKSIGQIILLASILITFTACESDESDENKATYEISGYTQKGPFVNGSSVDIQELDASLNPTGITYATETTNDLGAFEISTSLSSPYVEIRNTGFYFNEVLGVLSAAPITLRTLSDLGAGTDININVLTHLEKQRLVTLVDSGLSFGAARAQAQTEVLALFGIDATGLTAFDKMDIAQPGDSNAVLLAISAVLTQAAYDRDPDSADAELSSLLAALISDIAPDGILDSATNSQDLRFAGTTVDQAAVRANLETWYTELGMSATAPPFEGFIDSDADGLLDKDDTQLPADFDLSPVTLAARSTVYNSNTVVVQHTLTRAATEGAILVVNNTNVASPATVVEGDEVWLSLTSSPDFETELTATLNLGSQTKVFSVTTAPPPWTNASPMSAPRQSLASSVVEGKVYLIGGESSESYVGLVEVYEPTTDTWTTASPMPTARNWITSSVVDGRIYVFGGEWFDEESDEGGVSDTVEVYNPASDSWVSASPMPTARSAATSSVVDGKVYVFGGWGASVFDILEIYDPITDSWSPGSPMPTARYGASSSVVDGKIYVIGGGGTPLNKVEVYNPASDSWAAARGMPTSRWGLSSSVADGKIYALGGIGGRILDTVEVYDPITDIWTICGPMPTARVGLASSTVNDKIYIFGGWRLFEMPVSVDIYWPAVDF